jgi:hypothetical protein
MSMLNAIAGMSREVVFSTLLQVILIHIVNLKIEKQLFGSWLWFNCVLWEEGTRFAFPNGPDCISFWFHSMIEVRPVSETLYIFKNYTSI